MTMTTKTLWLWVTLAVVAGCAGGPRPTADAPPPPRIRVTGGATTGPLTLGRIEITLDNGFGSATVERNGPVRARAVINLSGNGLFRATWLVDGRPVEQVQHLVTYGTTLTLETGPGNPLPTFEPGNHQVTLRIDEPAGGLKAPTVRYFVK